jgi:hypothetical protein
MYYDFHHPKLMGGKVNKKIAPIMAVMALAVSVLALSCGGGDGGGQQACSYERRSSETCNHYDWGSWEADCYSFNMDDYVEGVTAQEVCDNLTEGGTTCELDCCIDVQYQNVTVSGGSCP